MHSDEAVDVLGERRVRVEARMKAKLSRPSTLRSNITIAFDLLLAGRARHTQNADSSFFRPGGTEACDLHSREHD